MSLFVCDECDSIENTALGFYWTRHRNPFSDEKYNGKALCSACCPTKFKDGSRTPFRGSWHHRFERRTATLATLKESVDQGSFYVYYGRFHEEIRAYIKQKSAQD